MKNMFSMPATFQKYLSENNHIEKIYRALENDDHSDVVITALDILKKTNQVSPVLPRTTKSVNISTAFRYEGNVAYKIRDYTNALVSYNKALLFAHKNSKEMVLAYSNRSQLLQCQKAYIASLTDIEICLTMECKDIQTKLLRRKKEVKPLALKEQIANACLGFSAKYIDTNIPHNSEISCASSQIKIDRSDYPKVVAAAVVSPGCVLANERAFVSHTIPDNSFYSCHFCQKMSLNLIPCDGCCHVLFCDEQCRKICMTEYHEYECQLMDILGITLFGPSPNLMFKASLKIRSMSKSWKKLIKDYKNKNIMQNCTIKEIFDYRNKFSILHTPFDKPFIYGILYNASFVCAALIYYLQVQTSFFPKNCEENDSAIRVFSRIMMFLSTQQIPIEIIQPSTMLALDKTNYFTKPNFGFYSFTGKIKTSCNPNIITINNNNQLILMALTTIKYGEELTISLVRFNNNDKRHERNFNNYWVSGTICNCISCDETLHSWSDKEDKLTKEQIQYYKNVNFQKIEYYIKSLDINVVFSVILKALDVLKDVPYSPQYMEVIRYLKKCILYFESVTSKNYL